jgi:hypothetical protein
MSLASSILLVLALFALVGLVAWATVMQILVSVGSSASSDVHPSSPQGTRELVGQHAA